MINTQEIFKVINCAYTNKFEKVSNLIRFINQHNIISNLDLFKFNPYQRLMLNINHNNHNKDKIKLIINGISENSEFTKDEVSELLNEHALILIDEYLKSINKGIMANNS